MQAHRLMRVSRHPLRPQASALYCEVCSSQLDATQGVCANPVCEIVCCRGCLCIRVDAHFCQACVEAIDAEQAELAANETAG